MTHANDEHARPAAGPDGPADQAPSRPRKRGASMGQTIGGVLFGFEQQVWRNQPPPHELVHHARPDDPLPAAGGGFVTIGMPDDTGDADAGSSRGAPDGPSGPASPRT